MLQVHAGRWCQHQCSGHVRISAQKSDCQLNFGRGAEKQKPFEGQHEKWLERSVQGMGNLALDCRNHWGQDFIWQTLQRSSGWVQARCPPEGSEDWAGEFIKNNINEARVRYEGISHQLAQWNQENHNQKWGKNQERSAAGRLWCQEERIGVEKVGQRFSFPDWEDEEVVWTRKGEDQQRAKCSKDEDRVRDGERKEETWTWQGAQWNITLEIPDRLYWKDIPENWGQGDEDQPIFRWHEDQFAKSDPSYDRRSGPQKWLIILIIKYIDNYNLR